MALPPPSGRFFEPGFYIKGEKIDMTVIDDIQVEEDSKLEPGTFEFRFKKVLRTDLEDPVRHTELVGPDEAPPPPDPFEGIDRSVAPPEAPLVPVTFTEELLQGAIAKALNRPRSELPPLWPDEEATGHGVLGVVQEKVRSFYARHAFYPSVILVTREAFFALNEYLFKSRPFSDTDFSVPPETQKLGVVMVLFGIPVVLSKREACVEVY